MANEQNLIPLNEQSKSKQREIQSQGGIASGQARREKRDLRRALEMLLEKEYKDKAGNSLTGTEAISAKLFEQAMKGNIRAFETLRDTVGQKPVDKVEMKTDMNIKASAERLRDMFADIKNDRG